MIDFFTAQMNVGKALKGRDDYRFIDTTFRSTDVLGQLLAPTEEMVKGVKYRGMSERAYRHQYISRLKSNSAEITEQLSGESNVLVFACYCGVDCFCHRHLLRDWLLARVGGCFLGELTTKQIGEIDATKG